MNSSFISELYNTPIANIIENWVVYVSHYIRRTANALYVADYKENTSFEQRERHGSNTKSILFLEACICYYDTVKALPIWI
jgi:hypothetical protein